MIPRAIKTPGGRAAATSGEPRRPATVGQPPRQVAPVDGMPEREPGPKPGTCGHPHPDGELWCFRIPFHPPPHARGGYVWLDDDATLPAALSRWLADQPGRLDVRVGVIDYQLELVDSISAMATAMDSNQVHHHRAIGELRDVLVCQRDVLLGRIHEQERQP